MRRRADRRGETVEYIQAMLVQLNGLARAEGCDMLAYLIEIACIEASDLALSLRRLEDGASPLPQKKGNGSA